MILQSINHCVRLGLVNPRAVWTVVLQEFVEKKFNIEHPSDLWKAIQVEMNEFFGLIGSWPEGSTFFHLFQFSILDFFAFFLLRFKSKVSYFLNLYTSYSLFRHRYI